MQLRLQLDIKALKGPMCVWMPPPPGDRLWFSFVKPPQLETTATPLVHPSPPDFAKHADQGLHHGLVIFPLALLASGMTCCYGMPLGKHFNLRIMACT